MHDAGQVAVDGHHATGTRPAGSTSIAIGWLALGAMYASTNSAPSEGLSRIFAW